MPTRIFPVLALFFLLAGEASALQVESPAFKDQGKIPPKYTCDGEQLSPPIRWNRPPEGTKSFALIVDDPDTPSGTWVHWVVYDLPADVLQLSEGMPKGDLLNGGKQGNNDSREAGYAGPCPPDPKPHRYFFKVYALNDLLSLPPKASKTDLLVAMNGHVLAEADIVGIYQRAKS